MHGYGGAESYQAHRLRARAFNPSHFHPQYSNDAQIMFLVSVLHICDDVVQRCKRYNSPSPECVTRSLISPCHNRAGLINLPAYQRARSLRRNKHLLKLWPRLSTKEDPFETRFGDHWDQRCQPSSLARISELSSGSASDFGLPARKTQPWYWGVVRWCFGTFWDVGNKVGWWESWVYKGAVLQPRMKVSFYCKDNQIIRTITSLTRNRYPSTSHTITD